MMFSICVVLISSTAPPKSSILNRFLPHIDKPRTSVGNTEQADVQASMPSWLVGSLNDEQALQVSYTGQAYQMLEKVFADGRPTKSHYKTIEAFRSLVSEVLGGSKIDLPEG